MNSSVKSSRPMVIMFALAMVLLYMISYFTQPIAVQVKDTPIRQTNILPEWPHGIKTASDANVSMWFNGYRWASVMSVDDCASVSDAMNYYAAINVTGVPTVAYLLGNYGNVSEILPSDSEIGLHYPHNWMTSRNITCTSAIGLCEQSKMFLSPISYLSLIH